MDPALLQLASYTANGTLYAATGTVFVYLGMNLCFPRRGSTVPFWAYFLFKSFAMSAFDAANVLGMLDGNLHALFVGTTCLFAILSYVVLYCTWEAEVLKIGLAGLIIDLAASFCVLSSILLVDGVLHQTPTLDYTGPLGWRSVLLSGMYLAAFALVALFLKPLARWIRSYEFKHRRLWQALVVGIIAATTTTRFTGFSDFGLQFLAIIVELPFIAGAAACYVAMRVRAERKRGHSLRRAGELMRSYDAAIREQGESLAANREALDALTLQVRQLEAGGGRDALLAALQELRRTSDRIRFGVHSDCPALDAVLVRREDELRARGLRAEFAIAPFGKGHARLAQAIYQVLGWAVEVSRSQGRHARMEGGRAGAGAAGGGRSAGGSPAPGDTVALRISRVGEQVFLAMDAPMPRNANFPRRVLDDVLASPAAVAEQYGGGRKTLLLMFGED